MNKQNARVHKFKSYINFFAIILEMVYIYIPIYMYIQIYIYAVLNISNLNIVCTYETMSQPCILTFLCIYLLYLCIFILVIVVPIMS